jgi:lipopolysaccharide transport protein LptA
MADFKQSLFIIVLTLILGFLTPEHALAQSRNIKESKAANKDKPIEITAERMRSEDGGVKIVFSGNVIGIWGDLTINSDILEIYNSGEEKKETDEIVAIGNVIITRANKKAKGDRAVYLDKLQKIILTGKPTATAWEDKNIIQGKEMIFLLEKDRFVVNDRVRMKLFPEKKSDKDKNTASRTGKKKVWVDAKNNSPSGN